MCVGWHNHCTCGRCNKNLPAPKRIERRPPELEAAIAALASRLEEDDGAS